MSEDAQDKGHEPSQKKLDDARARGDVARSADLTAAAGFAGLLLVALAFGAQALLSFGSGAESYLGQVAHLGLRPGAAMPWGLWGWVVAICLPILPFFIVPGLVAGLAVAAQQAWVFSGEKLQPQLARIDPLKNAGHKFGRIGLIEFAKSAAKFALVSFLLGWFLLGRLPQVIFALQLAGAALTTLMLRLLVDFLMLVTAISVVIGGLDYLWQHFEHLKRNRMSRQEVAEEFKDSEGDPHVKGQRRQRAQEIAMNRMLADVPKADVVVVNPTHYAVALKWNRKGGRAPVCLAKGVDEVAARIREAASLAGVPIHSDPPTARALHATIEIGREIAPEHYAAVAAAIRYAERMRKRARARSGR